MNLKWGHKYIWDKKFLINNIINSLFFILKLAKAEWVWEKSGKKRERKKNSVWMSETSIKMKKDVIK